MENTNEWTNWIEEAITKNYIKYYEYKQFSNIQEVGSGAFGKVFRANWKNLERNLALKSFTNPDNNTIKEIVCEVTMNIINHSYNHSYSIEFISDVAICTVICIS